MKKIKSIKINGKELKLLSCTYDGVTPLYAEIEKNNVITSVIYSLNYILEYKDKLGFEIEYEPEPPKLLKRPDRSLISVPPKGTEVVFIDNCYYINGFEVSRSVEYENCCSFETAIKQGRCFLAEDTHLAEKKAKMLSTQLEIRYEIDRLNAEDVDRKNQVYILSCYNDTVTIQGRDYLKINEHNSCPMSEKTAKTILEKYTQDELKAYLEIIE